jgi:MlaC protein
MSLKAQLDICRCSFEANAATDLVAAMQRSIRQLTETSLVANAVKAGEAAPRFRLRCGCRGFVDLSDLLDRGPVVVSFFRGDWCPSGPLHAAPTSGDDAVQSLYDALLSAMRNGKALGRSGRFTQLEPVIRRSFDIAVMARLSVGPTWASLTEAQRQQLTEGLP